ncbi:MAG: hypothetical protein V4858_21615 [Pseudomonadota bacterium]
MGALDQLNHLMNFLAPALAVAVLLAFSATLLGGKRPSAPGLFAQTAMNFIAGVVVLGLGLWFFGRDGKMASYTAMLLACTVSQGLALRR